jgi:hypothetical protein
LNRSLLKGRLIVLLKCYLYQAYYSISSTPCALNIINKIFFAVSKSTLNTLVRFWFFLSFITYLCQLHNLLSYFRDTKEYVVFIYTSVVSKLSLFFWFLFFILGTHFYLYARFFFILRVHDCIASSVLAFNIFILLSLFIIRLCFCFLSFSLCLSFYVCGWTCVYVSHCCWLAC